MPLLVERATPCHFCQKTIQLKLVETPKAARAWRMFDCPHCLKTNLVLLAAQVSGVLPEAGPAAAASETVTPLASPAGSDKASDS